MIFEGLVATTECFGSLVEVGNYLSQLHEQQVFDLHIFFDGANAVWRVYVFRHQTPLAVDMGQICSHCGGRGSGGFGDTWFECVRCNGTGQI